MSTLELQARAKINLSLDVTGKRPDGYHDLRMIMQTVELHDTVSLEAIDEGIEVLCDSPYVPCDSGNIAWKAANMLIEKYNIHTGIRIKIKKVIPVAAGMAGGSTNAAAVLKGINELFALNLTDETLMKHGRELGADVPYCIKGGTMLAEGIGDELTELGKFQKVPLVILKPRIGVSTAWVYKNLELESISERPDTALLVKAVIENDVFTLAKNMKNVLETVTIPKYNVVAQAKRELIRLGAEGSMMSGSGPSVFGIFKTWEKAQLAYYKLKLQKYKWDCYLTNTINEE